MGGVRVGPFYGLLPAGIRPDGVARRVMRFMAGTGREVIGVTAHSR
jgi:hypothetical protein